MPGFCGIRSWDGRPARDGPQGLAPRERHRVEGVGADVQAAGREVAAILEGRGGGSGRLFQGKASRLSAREDALARLTALVAGR